MTETAQRLGVIAGLPEDVYHADPDSISASGMKTLLRSPAHFLYERTHPKTSDALDLGTVAHAMVLGVGSPYVAVGGNRNRNDVKAAIAEAEAEGKVVLKPEQLETAERMADAVLTHETAGKLLAGDGDAELSMFWHDPEFDVTRRCRWDWLSAGGVGVDLKTTRDANPKWLGKTTAEYSYDLSAAWYLDVAAGLDVEVAAYALVFVESAPPHPVVVAELDADFIDIGARKTRRALEVYRRCLDTGEWPGYLPDDQYTTIYPPAWAQEN